ncbi:SUKH-4 family immunity protein [Streptomyces sp. NPDC002588]|uniref:SUKH-4 family immunity protein n=1 Tax=Streptomyces sp. NPDC002588 TaxID=3154419 RepID=UPI003322935C
MVTFAQAQERAEEWINGDVPAYQHREVRVREFELGFVVWAEDRAEGPRSDGGAQRLVIARDSGEATLWPALAVGEVIRRYEEEYGRPDEPQDAVPAPAARVDLNQTSFLLSPPEWLQEAADKLGMAERKGAAASGAGVSGAAGSAGVTPDPSLPRTQAGVPGGGPAETQPGVPSGPVAGAPPAGATPWAGTDTNGDGGDDRSVPLPATVFAPPLSGSDAVPPPAGLPDAETALIAGGSQLPPTAVAPTLGEQGAQGAGGARAGGPVPPPGGPGGSGGSGVPGGARYGYPQGGGVPAGSGVPAGPAGGQGAPPPPPPPPAVAAPAPSGPPAASYGYPQGGGAPGRPLAPNAGEIADAATSKAAPPPRRGRGGAMPPPPPSAPGAPGARSGDAPPPPPGVPGAPGGAAGGYVPTQMVSSLGPEGPAGGPGGSGAPGAPGAPFAPGGPGAPGAPNPPGGNPPGGVHHAATMLADQGRVGPGGAGGVPRPPGAPGAPIGSGAPGGPGVPHAQTVLAGPPVGGPGVPPGAPGAPGVPPGGPQPLAPGQPMPPGQPQGYGYPQPPGLPTVGPGYQAVLRYRAQDGSEQQVIRRSAPGTPHPEWQIFHELRAMNVPPDQVLELHTELESCELPGAYCARMIREQWPQARIASIAPYGTDHASRQQGMQQLLAHQGELHQVADGPARPAPVRAPLPPVQPAPPIPPEGIAQELGAAFGPGIFRFEQGAVSRQGVPPVVAHTLVVAGLPMDMGPFFWAQAQPGRPVPTLAELAAERGVQSAPDAGSYLVMGSDFGKAICVQYGTANIVAVPVEAGPGGGSVPPQFVNTGLPEFARCLALLGRMWRLRYGLNQEQAGRWTVDFQAQLASLDPAALGSPESWWSVLLEEMWDGLL